MKKKVKYYMLFSLFSMFMISTYAFEEGGTTITACKGSGVHCMDVKLEDMNIKLVLVKDKDEPGVVIKEE